ncbi:hypothetical protein Hanom_Chr00s000004g01606241 [Helianthus anomalus]
MFFLDARADLSRAVARPRPGHPDKFFGRSANFSHFDRNFVYILCSARANFSAVVLILVLVSFVPDRFNGQDPPLLGWTTTHCSIDLHKIEVFPISDRINSI